MLLFFMLACELVLPGIGSASSDDKVAALEKEKAEALAKVKEEYDKKIKILKLEAELAELKKDVKNDPPNKGTLGEIDVPGFF